MAARGRSKEGKLEVVGGVQLERDRRAVGTLK